ncbi:hypothetical protein [Actinocrinis sp.]|uniref:hypothetical protein n=1 Tax=Actinocrinis sp. TaxID=1920516 RepID=UPI002D6E6D10|nr:hypothetical protein [Actinocrinis sp.]HZP49959.1 hypothetical protein [Actinocrinis sp.]
MPPSAQQAQNVAEECVSHFVDKRTKSEFEYYFNKTDAAKIRRDKNGTTTAYTVTSLPATWFVQDSAAKAVLAWWTGGGAAQLPGGCDDPGGAVDKNPSTMHFRVTLTGTANGAGPHEGTGKFKFVLG